MEALQISCTVTSKSIPTKSKKSYLKTSSLLGSLRRNKCSSGFLSLRFSVTERETNGFRCFQDEISTIEEEGEVALKAGNRKPVTEVQLVSENGKSLLFLSIFSY